MTIRHGTNSRGRRPLGDYAAEWEANARADPRYAILSDPANHKRSWDAESFMSTGEIEVSRLFAELDRLGVRVPQGGTCLDFGCGIGRVTLALASRFETAIGVDVSPTMVDEATKAAAVTVPHGEGIRFMLNQSPDLAALEDGSIDFVYSNIVLQHLSAHLQVGYLREFVRVLRPGGLGVVQLPSQRGGLRGIVRRAVPDSLVPVARLLARPPRALDGDGYRIRMEMNCLTERCVRSTVASSGGAVEHTLYTNATEPAFGGQLEFFSRRTAVDRASGGGYVSSVHLVRRP